MFLWEKVALLRNGDASVVAMSPDQHLNHVGDAAVVLLGSLTDRFFDARVDSEVKCGYLGFGHRWLDIDVTRI
jgi:hypothetical protein